MLSGNKFSFERKQKKFRVKEVKNIGADYKRLKKYSEIFWEKENYWCVSVHWGKRMQATKSTFQFFLQIFKINSYLLKR